MHLLVSNHEAEIAAFRRAIGATTSGLRVVDNNLSALALIDSDRGEIRSLVITEHQDEGVNVETRTFVRNLLARTLNTLEIVVVSSYWHGPREDGVQIVPTVQEAAALVRKVDQLELVADESVADTSHSSNGHVMIEEAPTQMTTSGSFETSGAFERELAPEPIAQPTQIAQPAVAEPVPVPRATVAPPQIEERTIASTQTAEPVVAPMQTEAPVATTQYVAPTPPEETPAPAHSLADDIRDWTERNERERGQGQIRAPQRTSVWDSIAEMMPARRRAREQEEALDAAIRAPRITKCHGIAVISPKGGVGKSFLTYLTGNFLAEVRGDKVIAIDTNPDFGTLADQVRSREQQTVGTLLDQIQTIRHYSDLRRFTSKVDSRLEVLAAPADPDVMASISAVDYGKVYDQLRHYYDTVLFDCGTGFRDDITRFALQQCDQIVLVSAPLYITTGIVIRALGYLSQIGCDLSRVTLAINQVRNEKPLDIDYMRSRFGNRLNAIVEIPFDMQLYHDLDRGEFRMNRTQPATRISIKQLVSELVKHFE
ncbi:MAG TPA: AAA family ATPase [Herpetosiphonaceae bacterium]